MKRWTLLLAALAAITSGSLASAQIARESMKCLALTPYYPGAGILLSKSMADDIDYLNPAMIRVEIVRDGDDSINYCAYDYVVDRMGERGIQVLGLIDYATVGASGPAEWETEAYRTRFVDRVEELVSHFKDRTYPIKHWEIWNEEDLSQTGFDVRIEPKPYALLLIAAYDAIKSIDSEATVLLGGISPKGFEYSTNYLDELYRTSEMQAYYSTHGKYPFDVVACHPYPEIFTHPNPSLPSRTGLDDVLNQKIKAVMNAHGDRYKKVWLTEMGWSSYYVSEAQQALYLELSYELLDTLRDPAYPSDAPYVERYFWFQYSDFTEVDKWGLRTEDLAREKPAYASYLDLTTRGPVPEPVEIEPGENPPVAGTSDVVLPLRVSSSDLISGKMGEIVEGGFHSASTGTLAALTNGLFDGTGTTLVLRDYAHPRPALWVRFRFDEPMDLTEVRVFSGHFGDVGNRAFQSSDIYIDGVLTVSELNSGVYGQYPPGGNAVSLVRWLPEEGESFVARGVTTIGIAMYPVAAIGSGFRDRWDPCEDPLLDTDGVGQAFVSPVVKEIDVLGQPAASSIAPGWEVY